ncbi:MAG: cadmium-translocating P-type ATPase [Helicobacter trogontum]|uniref:heavy metal translocating P-type ATPase n=1 Tax=Helicobacter trogontum TaxID=50960 RepID=UPI00243127A1|nr:heavy metal translocating P-type ATPase [Helicobacter trogontum]MCI5787506.1 cadmium-translocating P-type ATPase [Helicobacter trogontum]
MQKFILENLDCNSCANKLEKSLQTMSCVEQVNINFNTNTLYIQTSDMQTVKAQIAKIEPNIIVRDIHDNISNTLSYKKELLMLLALLFGFAVCMLSLHYTPLTSSSFIQSFNQNLSFMTQETFLDTQNESRFIIEVTPFNILIYLILLLLYIIAGMPIFKAVWRNMKNKNFFDENTLMFVATIAAFCIGEISESVAVMLFFRIGEFLESLALKRSKKSLYNLLDITPEIAHQQIKQEDSKNAIWQDTHPELLKVNDIILVKVGEKVPVDGIIIQGKSALNMQALSGESKPVDVLEGDEVLAGAINMQGVLTLRVSKPFSHSQVAKIKAMMEDSSNTKAKSEQIITQFAKVYTPIMFFIALGIACIPPLFTGEWHEWIYRALVVLMVSCPCALVLSVPLGYFGALGIASKKGILIKGAMHFSNLAQLQQVVFDKTGTLTQGVFQIISIKSFTNMSKETLLEIAQRAQRFSNHPIAKAIMKDSKNTHMCEVKSFEEISGRGVYAVCCDDKILVGNESLMREKDIDISLFYTHKEAIEDGVSIIHIAKNGIYLGYITLGDVLKEESKKCLQALKELGVAPLAILSGDNEKSVAHIAKELGIQQYYAGLLPTQKVEQLQTLMMNNELESKQNNKTNRRHKITAFVGDGINDSIVLKHADIGISIATQDSHSDISKESADIILTNPSPMGIVHTIKIARKIQKLTWQNIIFVLAVKLFLVLLGVAGIANMWLAVFGDVGLALLALLNALRVIKI